MSNEELNRALYEKMSDAQERYRAWLLSQPPMEILDHCFEFTVREDIMVEMEALDLSDAQCKALLKQTDPLSDVFSVFENRETDHMEQIRDSLESCANAIIRREVKQHLHDAR